MPLALSVEPQVRNVLIGYTVPATGATLTISRVGPSAESAYVRGWYLEPVAAGPIVARDFEAPIGVELTYTAVVRNSGGATVATVTGTITVDSAGCSDTWLNDLARAGNTLRIVMEDLPELAYPVPATVHEIITRRAPIVSSDIAHTPAFELSFLTATDDEREQAKLSLGNGVPCLLRTPPENGIGNLYFAVLGFAEQRIVKAATVTDRRFVVNARQVERPDPLLYIPLPPVDYAYVEATFATYAALKAARATYDAVAYDWTGAEPADVFPWPPDDV